MNYIKKIKKCFNNKDTKSVLCITLSIIALYFLAKLIQFIYNNLMVSENFANSSAGSELLLLHMNSCGYCKKMMPEWHKFVNNNTTSIKANMVERSENPALMKKYSVTSFPTILLLDSKKNKIKSYEGKRTAVDFQKFCEDNCKH